MVSIFMLLLILLSIIVFLLWTIMENEYKKGLYCMTVFIVVFWCEVGYIMFNYFKEKYVYIL